MIPLPGPLHVVTDDEIIARPDFFAQAARVIQAGGPLLTFHLRAPRASGRRLYETGCALIHPVYDHDGWIVVNDRVDVAMAVEADGVQVGARGLHAADARRVLHAGDLLGVSVHSVDEARAARADGADYVFAGTIWPTPSHPERPGAGLGLIGGIAALGIPAIAIGGVTPERVMEAREAGAAGVAVLRGVWDAPDPAAAVAEYLEAWRAEPPVPAAVEVYVNGRLKEVPGRLTVAGLLRHLSLDPAEVGVALAGYPLGREEMDRMPVESGAWLRIVRVRDGNVEEIDV
jgi:thiamine-phosphate diphosphorylase